MAGLFIRPFQAINEKMNGQHPNETFSTPRLYDATERVLASQSPIVKISEIDSTRLKFEMTHTTASGSGTIELPRYMFTFLFILKNCNRRI